MGVTYGRAALHRAVVDPRFLNLDYLPLCPSFKMLGLTMATAPALILHMRVRNTLLTVFTSSINVLCP